MAAVKTKLRELSKKYHPDRSEGDAEIMVAINSEYAHIKKIQVFPIPNPKMPGSSSSQANPGNRQYSDFEQWSTNSNAYDPAFWDFIFGGARRPSENFRTETKQQHDFEQAKRDRAKAKKEEEKQERERQAREWKEQQEYQEQQRKDNLDEARFDELIALLLRGSIFDSIPRIMRLPTNTSTQQANRDEAVYQYTKKLDKLYSALGLDRESAAFAFFSTIAKDQFKIEIQWIRYYAEFLRMDAAWIKTTCSIFKVHYTES